VKKPTFIVDITVTRIQDIDEKGQLLMKPSVEKEVYSKIFDDFDHVARFLKFRPDMEVQLR
jgi:hypothetical protein